MSERNEVMRKALREDMKDFVQSTPGADWENLITEGMTFLPKDLPEAPDFTHRGWLPHHNEIAVDNEYAKRNKAHKLYVDPGSYNRQFDWRKKAAVEHIGLAYSGRGA